MSSSPRTQGFPPTPPARISTTALLVWLFAIVEAIGIGYALLTY